MAKDKIIARIAGLGSGFPDQELTNFDLEKIVDTSDQWISERTGIRARRKLKDNENNSDIAAKAALSALEQAKLNPMDIDLVIACTNSPDRWMPSLAATVQAKVGINNGAAAYDIITACAGWMVGLEVAASFVKSGQYKNVLVIGSEALSRFLNWQDRTTCVLFGDGAGASVVSAGSPGDPGEILALKVRSDGRYGDILDLPAGGSASPLSQKVLEEKSNFIRMNGQEIYKHAVRSMVSVCKEILESQNLSIDDIDWLVPHQANIRIIDAVGQKLKVPSEKVALNVHKYGNTSAATVPTCFDEYARDGRIKRGQLVLMTTFGGGLTWAGGLVRW
ncbi:MAG: ketoacyl-ACP synthase III [Oligoflexia bacterium]|nr:ketoacyl-ACP synthase III [Oligoflexia bacterium]